MAASLGDVRSQPLLDIEGLHVGFATPSGPVHAVRGISLTVGRDERVAIVGESGSGKSVTAHSILRLLPEARIKGVVRFQGRDLAQLPAREIRKVRGREIGMIFQDPMTALDPVRTIGSQVAEAGRHRGLSRREAQLETIDLLSELGIPRARQRFHDYPHHFSGGMRQRVVIAGALIGEPALLIADEPTTALDVIVQARLLEMLYELAGRRHMAVLLISHDLAVVGSFAERILVMYAGKIREAAASVELFRCPRHPYTAGLLRSIPSLRGPRPESLQPIKGQPPSSRNFSAGCAFAPRCPRASELCALEDPPIRPVSECGHLVACHHPEPLEALLPPRAASGDRDEPDCANHD